MTVWSTATTSENLWRSDDRQVLIIIPVMTLHYDLHELLPYINWIYFYHAWQLRQPDGQEPIRREAEQLLHELEGRYRAHALFLIAEAHSEGDDIVIQQPSLDAQRPTLSISVPCLRQQVDQRGAVCSNDGTASPAVCLCLSDFIHPVADRIGLFATSVDRGMEEDFDHDPYLKMMAQLLADRLAEAAAERMHEEVRKKYWGYAPDEQLTIDELYQERFQGIRPAVGYPSLPDASLNFLLDRLLDFGQIGITLTENGAMRPHASVSGLMLSHPQARYFSVGKIGGDQLADYARRRGLPLETIRKFLSTNL